MYIPEGARGIAKISPFIKKSLKYPTGEAGTLLREARQQIFKENIRFFWDFF